jgi:hypothetical protein
MMLRGGGSPVGELAFCTRLQNPMPPASATPRSATGACVGVSEGGAVAQRGGVFSLSATRVIHGAVLHTLTADETPRDRAAAGAVMLRVGKILVFAFRSAATALDDFTPRHLRVPPGCSYYAAFVNIRHSAFAASPPPRTSPGARARTPRVPGGGTRAGRACGSPDRARLPACLPLSVRGPWS